VTSRTSKLLIFLAIIALPIPALSAEKHGGDIWYKDTKKFAPALFSHEAHSQAGNQCTDCHDSLFQKKAGSADIKKALSKRNMKKGKFCGACHDGQKAFSVKKSCKKCHVKP
jgi:c(7)-type cytochrome triheme protein